MRIYKYIYYTIRYTLYIAFPQPRHVSKLPRAAISLYFVTTSGGQREPEMRQGQHKQTWGIRATLSIYIYIYIYIHPSIHSSINTFIHPSIHSSIHPSIYLFLSIPISIYLYRNLSKPIYVYLSSISSSIYLCLSHLIKSIQIKSKPIFYIYVY